MRYLDHTSAIVQIATIQHPGVPAGSEKESTVGYGTCITYETTLKANSELLGGNLLMVFKRHVGG